LRVCHPEVIVLSMDDERTGWLLTVHQGGQVIATATLTIELTESEADWAALALMKAAQRWTGDAVSVGMRRVGKELQK
jgi:hypothetical protein